MLTRGYSATRAGTFIIPIPGAIARAMNGALGAVLGPTVEHNDVLALLALVRGTS